MSAPAVRPPTVTLACTFLGVVSGLWLVIAGSYLTSWTDLQTQEQVREALAESGLRLSLDSQVEILRITLLVSAAVAVAGVILAVYALRGHRSSRVLLTLQAALLTAVFSAMGGQGLIPAALSIACIFLLWNRDARMWFARVNGVATEPVPPVAVDARPAPQPDQSAPETSTPAEVPAARGALPENATEIEGARLARRAAFITIIGSSLALVYGAAVFIAGTWFAESFAAQLRANPMAGDLFGDTDAMEFVQAFTRIGGLIIALSLLGLLAAALVARRHAFGRNLLYIASGATIAVAVLTFPLGLITAGLAIWVIVLLSRPAVKAWFDRS